MKTQRWLAMTFVLCLACPMTGHAAEVCAQLPSALQGVSVSGITQPDQLQKLDEQLESHLQPCMEAPVARNTKSICDNGRVVAEQVLRVIGRIDEAGKHNSFLSNAKLKSYKLAVSLLDKRKKLTAEHVCVNG